MKDMSTAGHESTITLSIKSTGSPENPSIIYHVALDGSPVLGNQQLSAGDWQAIQQLSEDFGALFEQRSRPAVAAGGLNRVGGALYDLWLARAWDQIKARLPHGAHTNLLIASDLTEALNLPWEILSLPGRDFIGFDPRFSVRRLPRIENSLPAFAGQLPAGPLRILFMACAPTDQAALDYEREEEDLLRAVASPNVHFYTGDLGTFEELRRLINEFEPHIVHLSGHGAVEDDGLGYFLFEDERGASDPRSSVDVHQLV